MTISSPNDLNIREITPVQKKDIIVFLQKRDTFVCLQTDYRKSLNFQLVVHVATEFTLLLSQGTCFGCVSIEFPHKVINEVIGLNANKPTGAYSILVVILKANKHVISAPLELTFNVSFSTGIVPDVLIRMVGLRAYKLRAKVTMATQ